MEKPMSSRPLWTCDQDWCDFTPLLAGEGHVPISLVTINRTLYVLDFATRTFRRKTEESWNAWRTDGQVRNLLEIVTATPCGLRFRWGPELGQFVSTTPVIAVFAGDLSATPDEVPTIAWDDWTIRNHPAEDCGAMNCERRWRVWNVGAT